jgi:dolichol-phosphate mannosyltransferase
MNVINSTVHVANQNWIIPTYDVVHWQGKRHQWCVVIPVINEGERISRLLERMADLRIADQADIIVMDGGSNDGSLSQELVMRYGVSGWLIKTGPGRLSAQLRCAYGFALEQAYNGIITIDGNNKDDPTTIPDFIAHLANGFDFVQASRFIKGGVAINTPWIRDMAIRWLHAPILRVFSGFAWTDTTQGYRAYSRRMLCDDRVAPFRSIFNGYELLAYLSYCAPRLGYQCIEHPTMRSYPIGKVPTKISTFSGNFSVFSVLLKACFGCYNPK